jgi:hypothetical protein
MRYVIKDFLQLEAKVYENEVKLMKIDNTLS